MIETMETRVLLSAISIQDASVAEGNALAAAATFEVTLDTASAQTVTVAWNAVVGGTASATDLSGLPSGVLTFLPGETQQQITIDVAGDTQMERHETFQVILTNPTNAILYDNLGLGTIVDEDVEAVYTTPTGPLDLTWDGDGIKNFVRSNSISDKAAGTAIDPDGRVLVFGNYLTGQTTDAFAIRYLPNGLPDPSFGTGGTATMPRPNNTGTMRVYGGAVYESGEHRGKVLVHASYNAFANDDIFIVRFNVDGSIDTTFGSNGMGYVQLDSGSAEDRSLDIAIYESGQNAGKFVVVGSGNWASLAATGLIARYDAYGLLDPSFGLGGMLVYRQTYTDADAAIKPNDHTGFDRVLIDSDGMLLISGTAGRPGAYDGITTQRAGAATLWRLDNAGNFDASFGTGGVAFSPLAASGGGLGGPKLNHMVIQSDGKIVQQVVAVNVNPGLALARFTPSGALDTSFGVDGNGTVTSNSFGVARTLSLDASDRLLVGGETGSFGGGHFFVTRFSADGVRDNIFDPVQLDGSISPYLDSFGYSYSLHGAMLSTDGNLLLAGGRRPNFFTEMTTVRYETARGDLAVTLTSDRSQTLLDGALTYTIRIRSNGDEAVFPSLRIAIPAHTVFVSLNSPAGWAKSTPAVDGTGNVIAASRGLTQEAGEKVFTLVVRLDGTQSADQVIAATVNVSSATMDYASTNNIDLKSDTISSDHAVCVGSSNIGIAAAGEFITYNVCVENNSAYSARNSTVATLPVGVDFVTATGVYTYDSNARTVTWSQPDLGAGFTESHQVQVRAVGPGEFDLTAQVTGIGPDSIPLDNTGTSNVRQNTGFVSFWRADGNLNDETGAHPGLASSSIGYAAGRHGNAFNFNGSNTSVDLGTWFNFQAFTVGMWINPMTAQVAYADIMDNSHPNNSVMQSNNSSSAAGQSFVWGLYDGPSSSNFNLVPNQWQYLTVTRDEGTRVNRVYVNGIQVGTSTGTGNIN